MWLFTPTVNLFDVLSVVGIMLLMNYFDNTLLLLLLIPAWIFSMYMEKRRDV